MIKVIISGAKGKMGRYIAELIKKREDMKVVAGADISSEDGDFTIYDSILKVPDKADVIIDFSNPAALGELCKYAVDKKIAMVIGTTGLNEEHWNIVKKASENIPIFISHNMSLGVFMLISLVKQAAAVLEGFDIEIIEKHHNQKIDAPSGTALMIADAIKEVRNEAEYVYGRAEKNKRRQKNEIGFHSIRGGSIVGEHDVILAGEDEIVEISHSVSSRKVFAAGAIKAAAFTVNQKPGYYTMKEMIDTLTANKNN